MSQISRLRAGAQHHLAVDLDHAVQVVDQGLHFGREGARQAGGFAGFDRAQGAPQARHRLEPEADLQGGRGSERKRKQPEGEEQRDVEGPKHALDDLRIGVDLEPQRLAAFEREQALIDHHRAVAPAQRQFLHRTFAQIIARHGQVLRARRRRFDQALAATAHLPGEAGPGLREARIGERPVELRLSARVDVDDRSELIEMTAHLAIHQLGRILQEECRDEDTGSRDADDNSDHRADDEARAQAAQEEPLHPKRYPSPRCVLIASRPSLRRRRAT